MVRTSSCHRVPALMHRLGRVGTAVLLLVTALLLDSCSSTKTGVNGLPRNLPDIALRGAAATPPSTLASYEYPFDSSGNYVSDWAAEGERKAGRPAGASRDDEERWSDSHGGGSKSKSKSKSGSSSKSKSVASSKKSSSGSGSSSGTKKSSSSSSGSGTKKSVAKSSSGGGGSYSVKKGDTLSAIARRKGTTVAKLKAANGLSSDNIGIGKVLKVPGG